MEIIADIEIICRCNIVTRQEKLKIINKILHTLSQIYYQKNEIKTVTVQRTEQL